MKLLIKVILLNLVLYSQADLDLWEKHKRKHGHRLHEDVLYDRDPHLAKKKYENFKANLGKVIEHNKDFDDGYHTYTKSLNQFSHYTYEEFHKKYLMNHNLTNTNPKGNRQQLSSLRDNYKELAMRFKKTESTKNLMSKSDRVYIDWSRSDCVARVKDQGACGSCYAYTSVGTLESALCIERHEMFLQFSKQQVIDCSYINTPDSKGHTYANQGCIGGNLAESFEYIKNNGLMPEDIYPYADYNPAASDTTGYVEECRYDRRITSFDLRSYGTVYNFKDMIRALRKGPLAAYIYVSENLYNYNSGVYTYDINCNNIGKSVNHAVIIVGFGREKGIYYWKVKNTWGTSWGENGYFKMALGRNLCNIEMQTLYPILR